MELFRYSWWLYVRCSIRRNSFNYGKKKIVFSEGIIFITREFYLSFCHGTPDLMPTIYAAYHSSIWSGWRWINVCKKKVPVVLIDFDRGLKSFRRCYSRREAYYAKRGEKLIKTRSPLIAKRISSTRVLIVFHKKT